MKKEKLERGEEIKMKDEYLKKIIDEHYKTTHIRANYMEQYVQECYILGYIDGYMKEEIYKDIIEKKEGVLAYEKGSKRGDSKRERGTSKEFRENKKYFISKLALFDACNSDIERNISESAIDMYNDYKGGELSFKTGKHTPKSKLK